MADMTRIVTAVIAITVRDYPALPEIDVCHRAGFSSCADDRRVHRRYRCSQRVRSDPFGSHADGHCRHPYGCCQAHHKQELMA